MRILPLSIAAAVAVACLPMVSGGATASPAPEWINGEVGMPPARLSYGVFTPGDQSLFQQAQFLWSGRNYCWYDLGWRGPGYYWCGYSGRRGYGWGGPEGWHGWARGGHGGGHRGGFGHAGGHQGGGHGGGGNVGGGRPGHGGGHMGGGHAGSGGHMGGGGGHGGGGHH